MPDHFQLVKFDVKASGNNAVVLVSGSRKYYDALRYAFPEYRFSRIWRDSKENFSWGTYLYNFNAKDQVRLNQVLRLFTETIYLDDALNQTFALSYHTFSTSEGFKKNEVGELVYGAKPYRGRRYNKAKAQQIADRMITFIQCQPAYARSDFIVPVPPSNPDKSFDLTAFLAQELSAKCNIRNAQEYVQKVRTTKPMKDLQTVREKSDNIQGAFQILTPEIFQGKLVLLVDDIYHSGATLHELASEFRAIDVQVQGLVATKTLRNPR